MNILKRFTLLLVFLVLFVMLILSLSFLAGQMPNRVNVIPKYYQSRIQLTFQAGYSQLLGKVAGLLGAAGAEGTQATVSPAPAVVQTPLAPYPAAAAPESAGIAPEEELFPGFDSIYPDPLPEQELPIPFYETITGVQTPDPMVAAMSNRQSFIDSINQTERGASLDKILGSVLDSQALDAIKAQQTDLFPSNIEANYFIHLPAIYMLFPRPEGYEEAIARSIQAVDIERYEASIRNLVENYSPRHHNSYQVIINFQECVQSLTKFEKHNLLRALEDTQKRFEALGYTVTQEPVADSGGSYNLIATKPAVRQGGSGEAIELGAHLDVRWVEGEEITPGANDNAAGVAGLLEIAATLKKYPNRHPWRFVVFVGSEEGQKGSQAHITAIENQPLKAALIMDGIGWSEVSPENMNCIFSNDAIPYTGELARVFDQVRQIYGIPSGWRLCKGDQNFSDQGSYWKGGLPAVLSVGGLPYEAPDVNQCSDNMDTLDLYNAYYAIQENLGVLLTLDQE